MNDFKSYNLLFLEDNLSFAKNTIEFFSLLFHNIYHAPTIAESLRLFDEHPVHLIISDIKVRDGNGLEFIQAIRERDKDVPIIVLSAHKDEDFLFRAIPLGLSDYLLKPIAHDDLMHALKKAQVQMNELYKEIRHLRKNYYYNSAKHTIIKDDAEVQLTDKESRLIELFLKQPSVSITKPMIEQAVYGEEGMSDAALKNLLLRLRKKTDSEFIQTIPGVGYRMKGSA